MIMASNSRIKRTIPLFIAVCILGIPAQAKYGGGNGTAEDPYLIYTAEQMNTIGTEPNDWDKYFKLMADIDLSIYDGTDFNIIGSSVPFLGVFDGDGHTISNFNSTSEGIFYRVENGEIKNLILVDPNVNTDERISYVAALAGQLENTTISNCSVEGGIVSGRSTVGGLVGKNYNSTITNCSFSGNVSGVDKIGGLVGWNIGTITLCYTSGDVSGAGQEAGGLVGLNWNEINNCYALADVSGAKEVSGLAGSNMGKINDCFAIGSVLGEQEVGGLAGGNNGIVANSYAMVDVYGSKHVGGLAGQNGINLSDVVFRSYIHNCYARGSVIGEENVGGIVGYNDRFGTIKNCYATGSVSGAIKVGGLIGQNRNGDVIYSFWDIETSGQTISAGGTGETTARMQNPDTYIDSGWIFTYQQDGPNYTWAEPVGGGYPILWWQISPLPELPFFSGGNGKLNDPYLITTAEELNMIGHNPRLMDAYFRLVSDIDLANVHFYMIGNSVFPFTGTFDGNGKRIFNFRHVVQEISQISTDENSVGFFKYVSNGRIKDLGIIDPNIDVSKSDWLGTLICWLRGGSVTSCYVQDGSISSSGRVGGLVAINRHGKIVDCHTATTIVGGRIVGGLVGDNGGIGNVSECYSNSSVLGERNTGGLIGNNSGQIFNCYSTGNISASNIAGGLVGDNEYGGEIICCYATSSVTGKNSIGGLVGYNKGFGTPSKISNCFASGIITGVDNVGGLVAYNNDGIISNCYSTSNVSGSHNIGGLVGRHGQGDVSCCYSTGVVSGMTNTGGLIGVQEEGSVYFSFWDIQTSQQSSSIGGMGRMTAEMQMVSTFLDAGWDFVGETAKGTEDIWWILEGQDYPRLWWEIGDETSP